MMRYRLVVKERTMVVRGEDLVLAINSLMEAGFHDLDIRLVEEASSDASEGGCFALSEGTLTKDVPQEVSCLKRTKMRNLAYTEQDQVIVDVYQMVGKDRMTAKEIAKELGRRSESVYSILNSMARRGVLRIEYSRPRAYVLARRDKG